MIGSWEKPYSVVRHGFFWWTCYAVVYEETELFYASTRKDAGTIAAMCNGAFNLGRMEGEREAGRTA